MIIAIDASVLLHLIDPSLPARPDSSGQVPLRCQERVNYFIEQCSKNGDRLLIPTPALSESLVQAGDAGPAWLAALHGQRSVRIAPFDEKAAVECAALAKGRGQRSKASTRAKAKFDEQIVAIAVAEQCELLLSDDGDLYRLAPSSLKVKGIGDLELPPEDRQGRLFGDGQP